MECSHHCDKNQLPNVLVRIRMFDFLPTTTDRQTAQAPQTIFEEILIARLFIGKVQSSHPPKQPLSSVTTRHKTMVDISDVTDNEVVMEEVTASPPPPANARHDDRLADAQELEAALANVKRPGARMHLQTIITKLHKECEALQRFASSDNLASSSPSSSSSLLTNGNGEQQQQQQPTMEDVKSASMGLYEPPTPVPKLAPAPNLASLQISNSVKYKAFPTHMFDAGKYDSAIVTVYVPLDNIGKHDKTKVTCTFTSTSFDLVVLDFDPTDGGSGGSGNTNNYRLLNDNLEKEIDPSSSKYIIKPNKIIIKLGKVKTGSGSYMNYDHWTSLTSKKPKSDTIKKLKEEKDNPMGGIMDMMKDMYDNGDESTRKMIGETMYKQRMGQKPDDPTSKGMGGLGMDDDMDDFKY